MVVNPVEMEGGFISEMPGEISGRESASIRAEMPQIQAKEPARSPMPISDTIEQDPALSVYLSQSYQQQQAYFDTAKRLEIGAVGIGGRKEGFLPPPYFDTAKRLEIGAVGIGGRDQGVLPPPYEVTILKPTQTLMRMREDGWNGVLPYNPYIHHNFMWRQPKENISIIW